MGQDTGHSLNLRIKLEQKRQKGEKDSIFLVLSEKEREGRDEESSSFSLRKFISSKKTTGGYRKRGISPRIQTLGNQRFRV